MTGDMANAELGVAETDAIGVSKRLSEKGGFDKQQRWGTKYMSERLVGSISVLLLFAVAFVWTSDFSKPIIYGVTALAIIIACALVWAYLDRRLNLLEERRKQSNKFTSLKSNA